MELRADLDNRWVKFEDVEFLIQAYPLSQGAYLPGTNNTYGEFLWERFDYCLLDWKNLFMDGEVFEFNDSNKRTLFDHATLVSDFILNSIEEFDIDFVAEKKTSRT